MDVFRGIVKIKYGGEEARMNLVQEPRDNGSTEDEDFTSATETESSSESDHGEVDLVLTIRDPVDKDERDTNAPLVTAEGRSSLRRCPEASYHVTGSAKYVQLRRLSIDRCTATYV